jgi:hypothetical protein
LVDNYFSRDDLGQGEVISFEGGRVHNYQELNEPNDVGNLLFNDEPQNNHSGVHQWYRWTMDPNGLDGETYCEGQTFINPALLDESLNPCTAGWRWAISNPNPTSEFGAPNGPSVGFIERVLSGIFTRSQRCSQLVGPAFAMDASCTEGSDALIAYEVEIPAGTEFISFEWRFGNRGDGDYAAVFIDEEPIWVMLGTSAFSDEFQSSGPVPIGDLEGSHELLVVLYGVNQANAGFTIRNFETIGVESLTLGAQKDAFIHFGAPNLNEGANPKVAVQVPLRQRAVVGFDETAITDFVNDHGLSKATLSLTIADVGGIGGGGRSIDLGSSPARRLRRGQWQVRGLAAEQFGARRRAGRHLELRGGRGHRQSFAQLRKAVGRRQFRPGDRAIDRSLQRHDRGGGMGCHGRCVGRRERVVDQEER